MQDIDNKYIERVPESCGIVQFEQDGKVIYISKSGNLRAKIHWLRQNKASDAQLEELFGAADKLDYQVTDNLVDALKWEKAVRSSSNPAFNSRVADWKHNTYLALHPSEFPFLRIVEYTDEDWLYLGPFRSRFFLMDVFQLMGKLLRLPACEVQQGPCDKLDAGSCRGWCQYLVSGQQIHPHPGKINPELARLDALLKEAYVHPDNKLLDLLRQEKNKYESNLEFARADLLTEQIELLDKYRQWLCFLYAARELSFSEAGMEVINGQLVHFEWEGQNWYSPLLDIKYRENERLAINKNLVDEAWILYNHRIQPKNEMRG